MDLSYRILNVFTDADNRFSGNPLCVFEDATGVSDEDMQHLARQLNLSETTFLTPGDGDVSANVRIFTPSYEMPFAGHPTLGTAYVARELLGGGDRVLLRMPAGDIPVHVAGNVWTLQANSPMKSADNVRAAFADPMLLAEFVPRPDGESLVYLWARTGPDTIESRFFFTQSNAAIEDPATGSACANLGGWFVANGELGIRRRIRQGSAIHRPSVLDLDVDDDGTIFVSGTVGEFGCGTFTI